MGRHNPQESHGVTFSKHPAYFSFINVEGTGQTILLTVLQAEGVINPQGCIDAFYKQLGELEKDVDLFTSFIPINNPLRERNRVAALTQAKTKKGSPKKDTLKKGTKQRLQRLVQMDFWKISILIHVKSSFSTELGEIDESLRKAHDERVLKVIGAWNAEFRPSKAKPLRPRHLSDLFPTTISGKVYGNTQTVLQLNRFPKRMNVTPAPAFEFPPSLPVDIVLGKAVMGRIKLFESVGLPFEALRSNIAIFGVNSEQKTRILHRILDQTNQLGQSCLILDTSGHYSMLGNVVLKPGIDFFIAPLNTEGLSPEQYTDLFFRAFNLFLELPESKLGELAGLLLTLYDDRNTQISLQTLYQVLSGDFSGEEDPTLSSSFYLDTYGLRGVAALLTPLLHGRAGATFSAAPNVSTIKSLESYLVQNPITVIDLSSHTTAFKQFFMALLASKLLAFRRGQIDQGFSSKGIILVLDDIDFFLRKGDYKLNQRLDNFLPVVAELERVKVGLITLGTTPEVLWPPAFSLIAQSLILSRLTPDAARFIEKYLDLATDKADRTKRKFLQQLGEDDILLVKRCDSVEPFLCQFDLEEPPTYPAVPPPMEPLSSAKDDQKLLNQMYDLNTLFDSELEDVLGILKDITLLGKPVPYVAFLTQYQYKSREGGGGREALVELFNRMEKFGLIKLVISRDMNAERTVDITPIGRVFFNKHQKPTPPSPELELSPSLERSVESDRDSDFESTELDIPPAVSPEAELSGEPTFRSRMLFKDWITAKNLFRGEQSEAWDLLKKTLQEALTLLYTSEHRQAPRDIEVLLNWIRNIPEIDRYLYPELEETLLSQGNGFDPEVFTPDVLQMYEDLFACGSGYPRVLRRTAEVELLVKTQPEAALKLVVSLVTDLFAILLDIRHSPPIDTFGSFLEAFSLVGAFLPHKTSFRELETIFSQIQRGDLSPKNFEEIEKLLENFNIVIKDLEASIFDLEERMIVEIRHKYNQHVHAMSETQTPRTLPKTALKRKKDPLEGEGDFEDEDEVLNDLMAVGSEELVLIDCGRFIREGLSILLEMSVEQIHLDRAKRFLTLILNDPHLKIPRAKGAKKVLDALSFLIETGELPPEDIRNLAQLAQKFANGMKTYTPDSTEQAYLRKLFEMAEEPEPEGHESSF